MAGRVVRARRSGALERVLLSERVRSRRVQARVWLLWRSLEALVGDAGLAELANVREGSQAGGAAGRNRRNGRRKWLLLDLGLRFDGLRARDGERQVAMLHVAVAVAVAGIVVHAIVFFGVEQPKSRKGEVAAPRHCPRAARPTGTGRRKCSARLCGRGASTGGCSAPRGRSSWIRERQVHRACRGHEGMRDRFRKTDRVPVQCNTYNTCDLQRRL